VVCLCLFKKDKKLQKLLFGFALCFCSLAFGQFTISGQILDENNRPMQGCHIHIGNKSTNSDAQGFYVLNSIPKGKVKMYVSNLGYVSMQKNLLIESNAVYNLNMVLSINRLQEVAINQQRNTLNNSVLEQKIKSETIEKYSSQQLGDALKEIVGISVLRTGSNIVKPIINGLHSNRVPIISNNVRLEDQEWGAEHAPNFDVNAAGKITVIKGASGLQYGGDAIGGIVIIEPIEVKKDTLFGKTIINGASNGRGGSISSSLHKGNFCDWSWNAVGTYKYFGDRTAPNYVLTNSGNREFNFSGDVKFARKKYAVSVFYSLYNAQIGILSASHIGNVNDLYNAINFQIPAVVGNFSYAINNPKQEVSHNLVKVNFDYFFSETAKVTVQYSFQYNKRLEFDLRRGIFKDVAALDLALATHTVKVDYKKSFENFTLATGFNLDYQNNVASPLTGVRPLIPDFQKKDFGIYAIANVMLDKDLTLDFGLRSDVSNIEASKFYFKSRWNERGYNILFPNFVVGETAIGDQWLTKPRFDFQNLLGSIGIHKVLEPDTNWFVNLSLASRNPNPSELFSDGLHHSTGQIELGDLALRQERSFKFSTTLQKKWKRFAMEINPFINQINNFMFLKPTGFETTIRGAFPVWNYQQTNALLTGFDCSSVWEIAESWKHQFSFAAVNGFDLSQNLALIAMPPTTFSNKILFSKKAFHGLSMELKNEVVLRQTQFPNNNFLTPIVQNNDLVNVLVDISSPPKAYQLWSFYSEMKFKTFKKNSVKVAFSVQNILNTNYRDYLNNQRFFVDELGRNFQIQINYNY
jgi:iron complex outermembrane receptor protein